jgi:hypothetical protein
MLKQTYFVNWFYFYLQDMKGNLLCWAHQFGNSHTTDINSLQRPGIKNIYIKDHPWGMIQSYFKPKNGMSYLLQLDSVRMDSNFKLSPEDGPWCN